MPEETPASRPPRAKRARYEDVARLERRINELEAKIAARPVESLDMPMTKELFMGLASLAMLSGGEVSQLKYLHQQVPFAYEQWVTAIRNSRAATEEPQSTPITISESAVGTDLSMPAVS